jgi:long-subunit acyl-CoA synthetase (AMP-forming)
MSTHRNYVANAAALIYGGGGLLTWKDDDFYLSYLPLAHCFERDMQLSNMFYKV